MEKSISSGGSRTLSLQLTVEPITKQVGEPLHGSETNLASACGYFRQISELEKQISSRRGGAFPNVVDAATAVRASVCSLQQTSISELSRSEDKVSLSKF